MGQTLFIIVNDTVSVTLTAATLTGTQGAYVYGPVTATITPAGASTVHRIEYQLPDALPVGMSVGAISDQWNWLRNGSARSATTSDTILQPLALTPPLTAVLVGNGEFTCGDTGSVYRVILQDANGSLNLTTILSGNLHIEYADGDTALPNQHVATAAVSVADQSVPANLGLVSYAAPAATLTRKSKALHEVRVTLADATTVTFKGDAKLSILLPCSTP